MLGRALSTGRAAALEGRAVGLAAEGRVVGLATEDRGDRLASGFVDKDVSVAVRWLLRLPLVGRVVGALARAAVLGR